MSFEKYLDQILDQNIISKLVSPKKESFPLGDFSNYQEIPLGWTKDLNYKETQEYKSLKKFKRYIFIGMGGAISMARIASYINPKQISYIDSFDISKIKKLREDAKKSSTVVFVCSKSNETIETKLLENLIAENKKDKFYITDEIKEIEYSRHLKTPRNIGGRYSISTHLGVLPFYLAGFSLEAIANEINKANKECRINDKNNPAIRIAAMLYTNYINNKEIVSITPKNQKDFVYDWLEQLISESAGKEEKGLLPIKSSNISSMIKFTNKNKISENSVEISIEYNEKIFFTFQKLMYSISIFCSMINVQPFDQPNVESTKIRTKNLLEQLNDNKKIFDKYSEKNPYQLLRDSNSDLMSFLIFSSNLDNMMSEKLVEQIKSFYGKNKKVLIFFGPSYLHSTGQLLKGSFKNINNFVIYLHGNEDLNIPNSLYTLNTFVKNQGFSDHLEMKKNKRNSFYFETTFDEIIRILSKK
tara:strand:+ start:7160 stop:8575 length:1416 start_codon:yes stop_codon:yes gene_type:complete